MKEREKRRRGRREGEGKGRKCENGQERREEEN